MRHRTSTRWYGGLPQNTLPSSCNTTTRTRAKRTFRPHSWQPSNNLAERALKDLGTQLPGPRRSPGNAPDKRNPTSEQFTPRRSVGFCRPAINRSLDAKSEARRASIRSDSLAIIMSATSGWLGLAPIHPLFLWLVPQARGCPGEAIYPTYCGSGPTRIGRTNKGSLN